MYLPFTVLKLGNGCRAIGDQLELPIYFEEHSEYQVLRETRVTTPIKRNLSSLPIWKSMEAYRFDFELDLQKLPPIENKPVDELMQMLEEAHYSNWPKYNVSATPYLVIAIIVIIIIIAILVVIYKRHALTQPSRLR